MSRRPTDFGGFAGFASMSAVAVGLLITRPAPGPQMERQVGEETREGVAIQLLVDISSSMEQSLAADDGERISRLEATKRVVDQFVRHRADDLIGLITFARYADTLSPLTYGHDALVEIIPRARYPGTPFAEDGTGYGDALALACARLDQMGQWQPARRKGVRGRPIARQIRSKVVVLAHRRREQLRAASCRRKLPGWRRNGASASTPSA